MIKKCIQPFLTITILIITVIGLIVGTVSAETSHFINDKEFKMKKDYVKLLPGDEKKELIDNLKLFQKDDSRVKDIIKHFDDLPEAMQYMVGKNPMVIGLALDYINKEQIEFELGESIDLKRNVPYYIQWDRRWGNKMYGPEEIALNGCGPTSLAMVFSALKEDPNITPLSIVKKATKNDVTEEGTVWIFMETVGKEFDIKTRKLPFDDEKMKKALDNGELLVATINPGEFIGFPHIFAIIGYNEDGYIVNDPVLYENTLETWTVDELEEIQAIWAYKAK